MKYYLKLLLASVVQSIFITVTFLKVVGLVVVVVVVVVVVLVVLILVVVVYKFRVVVCATKNIVQL